MKIQMNKMNVQMLSVINERETYHIKMDDYLEKLMTEYINGKK